ncbi:unnamed protein product [Peniophora sp. CBMAI 1063]|nr:unnamed protein product [Peniophora sp. CBMAI 1063]
MPTHINSAPIFRAQTYTGYVPQPGDLLHFKGFERGHLKFERIEDAPVNNPAYTFRAQTYTGYVPQDGDSMRCMGFKNGHLELERVEGGTVVQDENAPKFEDDQTGGNEEPTGRRSAAPELAPKVEASTGVSSHLKSASKSKLGQSTPEERADMAKYIFSQGRLKADGEGPKFWEDFRTWDDHERRKAAGWKGIYERNKVAVLNMVNALWDGQERA